ncbi:MAG: hypothetical protein PHS52_06435 [Desulfotomaculaceae bacterium]|nr:hypothetical protein [Desulfotomaculaceae bacterium]
MKWLLLAAPLAVAHYTYSYGRWAIKNGYRRGGAGALILAVLTLALSVYALYLKQEF